MSQSSIDSLATGTYSVSRRVIGSYDSSGRYQEAPTATTFTVTANVQPLSGAELQTLSEAERTSDTRVVYTRVQLNTRTPANEPDIITIGGSPFTVYKSEYWQAFGREHWKSLVTREVTP